MLLKDRGKLIRQSFILDLGKLFFAVLLDDFHDIIFAAVLDGFIGGIEDRIQGIKNAFFILDDIEYLKVVLDVIFVDQGDQIGLRFVIHISSSSFLFLCFNFTMSKA